MQNVNVNVNVDVKCYVIVKGKYNGRIRVIVKVKVDRLDTYIYYAHFFRILIKGAVLGLLDVQANAQTRHQQSNSRTPLGCKCMCTVKCMCTACQMFSIATLPR